MAGGGGEAVDMKGHDGVSGRVTTRIPDVVVGVFLYTIHEKVKRAYRRLVEYGGCARFGMNDGYMMGPMEVVF